MVNLGGGFLIFKELAEKIYSHQKEGVLWMWKLHQKNKGGILADDMGHVSFAIFTTDNLRNPGPEYFIFLICDIALLCLGCTRKKKKVL